MHKNLTSENAVNVVLPRVNRQLYRKHIMIITIKLSRIKFYDSNWKFIYSDVTKNYNNMSRLL